MSPSQIIVLATPVFFAADCHPELAVGWRRQRNTYRLADAVSSISLGMLSQIRAAFTQLLAHRHLHRRVRARGAVAQRCLLTSSPGQLLALVFYDFCYYWLHRMRHRIGRAVGRAHAVHHQSQDLQTSRTCALAAGPVTGVAAGAGSVYGPPHGAGSA